MTFISLSYLPEVSEVKMSKLGSVIWPTTFLRKDSLNYRFSVETLQAQEDIRNDSPITKLSPEVSEVKKFKIWDRYLTKKFFIEGHEIKYRFSVKTLQVQEGHSGMTFSITKLSPEVSEVKNVQNWDRSFDQLFLEKTWLKYRFSVRTLQVQRT